MCKTKKRYRFNVAKIVHKVIVDYSCVLSHNEKKLFIIHGLMLLMCTVFLIFNHHTKYLE